MNKVTVIVPVYGDWPSLGECIDSLIRNIDDKHKVLLCNDNGPEADKIENGIKKKIEGLKNFEYHCNSENLGFVKNCNRAVFELDKSNNDILLLNSDTVTTPGFLEPMQVVLESREHNIVAVSPRSNNATIATIPIKAATTKDIEPKNSYAVFNEYNWKFPLYSISPVAHGFCMLIRRDAIKKFGLFDEVFGKGYGEEVDFCMRLQKQGYLSAICHHSFVFHAEAKSFSLEKKAELLMVNEKIVVQRYPNYRKLAREYRLNQIDKEELIYANSVKKMPLIVRSHLRRLVRRSGKLQDVARKVKKLI